MASKNTAYRCGHCGCMAFKLRELPEDPENKDKLDYSDHSHKPWGIQAECVKCKSLTNITCAVSWQDLKVNIDWGSEESGGILCHLNEPDIIEVEAIAEVDIRTFAKCNSLKIKVREIPDAQNVVGEQRWVAEFVHCEQSVEGGFLKTLNASGKTEKEALKALAKEASFKDIVYRGNTLHRRDMTASKLTYGD